MARNQRTLYAILITIAAMGLWSGCGALDRGDLHRAQENSLYFTSIGFLAGDNPGLLYRNAITTVHHTDSNIEIVIPYFRADAPTTPLIPNVGNELAISFDLVGKDAVVYEGGVPVNQGDAFSFHSGAAPIDRIFTVQKTDPITGSISSRSFTISVRKEITPKATLIQHPFFDDAPIGPPKAAVALDLHFVDELGGTIPITGADNGIVNDGNDQGDGIDDDRLWLADGSGFGEDDFTKDIQVNFTTWMVNPDTADHYIADTRLYNQGSYQLAIPSDMNYFSFTDADGYACEVPKDEIQKTVWISDAIYMAEWGSVGASGLTKTDPVPTLAEAMAAMATAVGGGDPRFEIRIAEGNYNLGTGFTIDTNVSIYGGYRNDFSSRWDMTNPTTRNSHASRFYGSPPGGTGTNDVSGALTWEPAAGENIDDSSVLDGVMVFAAPQSDGGQDWTAALVLRGGLAAEINSVQVRNSTFIGGGGGFQNSFGVALHDADNPLLFNNLIASAEVGGNDTTAGLLASQGGVFTAAGNTIIGEGTDADDSFGIRLISAQAEIVANYILAGESSPSESVGISAISCGHLRVHGNTIETSQAFNASCGISMEIPGGEHFVFNNAILPGNGGASIGIRTVDAGGGNYEIINNAIRTGTGSSQNIGLYFTATVPGNVAFLNNLVDSTAADLVAIETAAGLNATVAGLNARGNAFDDADHDVEILLTGDAAYMDAADAQDSFPAMVYNIEKNFAFNDLGRITSGLDANLAYGGVSGWSYTSEPAPQFLNQGRGEGWRSNEIAFPEDGGWSIGPFEFNQSDVAYPNAICVAEGRGVGGPGSDMHLLGTKQFPFEFPATGINAARDRSASGDVWEVRVAEGTHSAGNITLDTDMRLLGGWTDDFASRNYNTNLTVIDGSAPGVFFIDNVSDRFLMEGFTLKSTMGANVSLAIVQNGARPILRHLIFEADAVNTGYTGLRVQTGASPQVYNCLFDGGTAAGNTENIVFDNAGGVLRNNQIKGGSPSSGSAWDVRIVDASPEVSANTINGGSPDAGNASMIEVIGTANPSIHDNVLIGGNPDDDAIGLYWSAATAPAIYGNTIDSGDSISADAVGMHITGAGANPEIRDNTITAGAGVGSATTGIRVNGGASPYIHHNLINLNDGGNTDVFGIDMNGSSLTSLHDNTINGGTGAFAYGIYVINSSEISIHNNVISGGIAAATNDGIFMASGSDNKIINNTVNPGTAPTTSGIYSQSELRIDIVGNTVTGGIGNITRGIYLNSSNESLVDGNRAFGGEGAAESVGLYIQNSNDVGVLNSLIHGGMETGGEKQGILVEDGDNQVSLYNNTIYAGRGGINGAAIHTTGTATPRIINNIIIAGAAAAENMGVWQESGTPPARFLHNIITGAEPAYIPYRDDGGGDHHNSGSLEGYFSGPSIDHDIHMINPGEVAAPYLRRFTNDGDWNAFLGDNWRLSGGGSLDATGGGLPLDADGVWPFDNDFTYDHETMTGIARTGAWSVGAYEF